MIKPANFYLISHQNHHQMMSLFVWILSFAQNMFLPKSQEVKVILNPFSLLDYDTEFANAKTSLTPIYSANVIWIILSGSLIELTELPRVSQDKGQISKIYYSQPRIKPCPCLMFHYAVECRDLVLVFVVTLKCKNLCLEHSDRRDKSSNSRWNFIPDSRNGGIFFFWLFRENRRDKLTK